MTENGPRRVEWPNGRCYLEQENLLVEAFVVIRAAKIEIMRRQHDAH